MDAPATTSAPVNVEIEQALLGALLLNSDAFHKVAPFLRGEHFSEPVHQELFELFAARMAQGQVVDARTVRAFLDNRELGETTVHDYVARLAQEAIGTGAAEEYGRLVHDLAVLRKVLTIAEDAAILASKLAPDMPVGRVIEEIESRFAELRNGEKIRGLSLNLAAAVQEALDAAAEAYRHKAPVGWAWVLPEIHDVVRGPIEPGNLYGLLGGSGDGKTSLTLQQLRYLAEQGVPCLFLSGEQTHRQCVWQMNAQKLSIDASRMRDGQVSEAEFDQMYEDGRELAKLPFAIQKWSGLTVGGLATRIRGFVKRYGPGVVAIDHAKKIKANDPKANLADQVFQVGSDLKDTMADTGCAGLVLFQRNSEFLKRNVQRPVRADFYGGEGVLQNLDAAFSVFRAEKWIREKLRLMGRPTAGKDKADYDKLKEDEAEEHGRADLDAHKNRFGEEGAHRKVRFVAEFTRFESLRDQGRLEGFM